VLPATRTLNPIGKDSSPIITQSSAAVTHCILAAPQFTYPEGTEGWTVRIRSASNIIYSFVAYECQL
jgi:hypothetical protein